MHLSGGKNALFKWSGAARDVSMCHFVHLVYQLEVRQNR